MGRWLAILQSKNSGYLDQQTAKSAKTTVGVVQVLQDYLEDVTDKTDKTLVGSFCQLVRHYGADRQRLLSYEEIMAELDADDLKELERTDRHDRQIWAELLAHRLTRRAKKSDLEMAAIRNSEEEP